MVCWGLIRQQNQAKNHKYNTHNNSKIVEHNYKVGDNVVLNNNDHFKYETLYDVP